MILVFPLERWPLFAPAPAAAMLAALPIEAERVRFQENALYTCAKHLARLGIPAAARRRACAAYGAVLRNLAAEIEVAGPGDHRPTISLIVRAMLAIYGEHHPLRVRDIVEPLRPFAPDAAALGLVRAMRRKANRLGPPPLELILAEAEKAAQVKRRSAVKRGAAK